MKLKLCMLFAALAFWAPGWADSDRWKDNGNQRYRRFAGLIWTKPDKLKPSNGTKPSGSGSHSASPTETGACQMMMS